MDLELPDYKLRGLSKINIIVGRNGIGKSNIMRHIASRRKQPDFQNIFPALGFINPERAGELQTNQGIEQQLGDENYLWGERAATNQSGSFRQQVATRFRILKDIITQEAFENKTNLEALAKVVNYINTLLENIEFILGAPNFVFKSRVDGVDIPNKKISSGETEVVSLAIEVLHFIYVDFKGIKGNKLIIIDEPDVHLHPDLQAKFMDLLVTLIEEDATLCFLISTHSISVVGAVATHPDTRVCYLHTKQSDLNFESINDKKQRLLPILGTNLLSRAMIDSPLLIVEGIDDVAIWNQAVRTSSGAIKASPCACYSKNKMEGFESEAASIAGAIYDTPLVLSLQDGDGGNKTLETLQNGVVQRCYLQCYAAENLVLTDEVFAKRNKLTWEKAKERITQWIGLTENKTKPGYAKLSEFADGGFLRKSFPLKTTSYTILDNILEICEISHYRWLELVGKCIGDISGLEIRAIDASKEGSIANYLGVEVIARIIKGSADRGNSAATAP